MFQFSKKSELFLEFMFGWTTEYLKQLQSVILCRDEQCSAQYAAGCISQLLEYFPMSHRTLTLHNVAMFVFRLRQVHRGNA
jgi:hypothetical protein